MGGPVIVVEGTIGTGKSTMMDHLGSAIECNIFPEDVVGMAPYLKRAYSGDGGIDMLQLRVLADQMKIKRAIETSGSPFPNIIERWSGSAQEVFMRVGDASGSGTRMSAAGRRLYDDLLTTSGVGDMRVDGYIFIDTPPEECFARATCRARTSRPSESGIMLDYLNTLHGLYAGFIARAEQAGTPVLRINNSSMEHLIGEGTTAQVRSFIASCRASAR